MSVRKHVLFIMPYGKNNVTDSSGKGIEIDFNEEYKKMKKSLAAVDRKAKRKYLYTRVDHIPGQDIYKKMWKAIKAADIVLVDVTTWNHNVMYELGARHTLKNKITILYNFNGIIDKTNPVPFDINTYAIYSKEYLKTNWAELSMRNHEDSPILKEIKLDEIDDKSIFHNSLEQKIEKWEKEFSRLKNKSKWPQLNKMIDSARKSNFLNNESLDQKSAFVNYKMYEDKYNENKNDSNKKNNFIKALNKSKDTLSEYNPLSSNNSETIGLMCSITRKLYELTGMKKDKIVASNYTRHFTSVSKDSYAYSSHALYLITMMENGDCSFKYYKEEGKNLYDDFEHYCDDKKGKYYLDTKNLINAIKGIKTTDYDKNKKNDRRFKTSKRAYKRAEKIINKYKKINKNNI